MQSDHAALWRPRQANPVGLVLVLLSLTSVGLPNCRAQMEFDGGYIQTHREDRGEVPSLGAIRRVARPIPKTPFSYSPDQDYYYSSFYLAAISLARSEDSARSEPGDANSSLSAPAKLPINVAASALPWNRLGFKDYDESLDRTRDASRSYFLVSSPLSSAVPTEGTESATLIAHLPEHAILWVEGVRTKSTGRTRFFQSPPLLMGRTYNYRLRAAWIENGRWVSQSRNILVQAGMTQAIYLRLDR